ncbi:MAG TPA: RDD family protein [Candidatus Eisenbacteria bacterium]|nr:RDD family protein [Candidatus Eisenbacteria bacterium]
MDEQQTPGQPPAMEPPPTAAPPPASSWEAAPAAAPAPVPGAAGFVYADVPNRVFALIIDGVILAIISIVIGLVLGAVGLATGSIGTTGVVFNPVATIVYAIIGAVIYAAYFIWSWTTQRATLGMRALGMQVGNAFDGKTLTTDQALRRAVALWGPGWVAQFFNALPAIGAILSLLALLWGIYLLYSTATSPTKQGFHDKFANTVVVKAGRVV